MIQSLQRAHAILALVRSRPEGVGVRELARELGLHAATVSNLVRTLHELGYLHADAQRRYHLGVQAAWPGWHDEGHAHLAALAEAPLRAAVGERRVSELSVLRGLRRHCVLILRRDEPAEVPGRIGDQLPLHETTIGRCLLAWAPSDLAEDYIERAEHSGGPEHLADAHALRAELEVVRSQGYAESGRTRLGAHLLGVAMPIRDPRGQAVAACNLHIPHERAAADEHEALVRDLAAAVHSIRHALGWEQAPCVASSSSSSAAADS